MLDELYMQDLANAMRMPEEVLPAGKVTVSGPQVETQPKQPEMGTITGIPQTAFEKALETSGAKLSELGDMIDQSAPGTLNTLLGREVPIIGNLKLRDFLPFVGSKDDGKLTGTPAALIAAGTGQPLRGQPIVSSTVGPDGRTYFSASGSPAMLSEDVGAAMVDVATLGLGRPIAAGAKKAVKATKGLPVGMSTKAVGQGINELGFYSAAKQAVDAIQQPKGTGEQFLKQIEKTPGVKPDEIKWTGLDEFLQSKKSVTKAEVQEYLDKNRVQIKEVQLGGGYKAMETELNKQGYDLNVDMDGDWSIFKNNEYVEFDELPQDLQKFVMDNSPAKTETKFSKYTLPGGKNYREILLTLPNKNSMEAKALYQKDILTEEESKRLLKLNQDTKKTSFQSQHFDQPNILAHMRVNDRVDADGKKVLFVEEVQSDWHQAGRKKGYKGGGLTASEQVEYDALQKEADALMQRKDLIIKNLPPEQMNRMRELSDKRAMETKGVPDAPFKGNWHELAMKRAIQMASEGGYDRIAFTTGKTQAERFDLSKQVNMISAMPDGAGKYNIYIEGKDGDALFRNQNGFGEYGQKIVTPEEFEELVGKDVASKVMQKTDELNRGKVSKDQYKFYDSKPADLTIGGEGMKGFYDDILPKFLDKYAKKWDAKTGQMDMFISPRDGAIPVNYIDVTPKMRESVVTKGQPLFAVGAGGAGAAATQEENK